MHSDLQDHGRVLADSNQAQPMKEKPPCVQ